MKHKENEDFDKKLENNNIKFCQARLNEIDEIIDLYRERIRWFKANNIRQWCGYLNRQY